METGRKIQDKGAEEEGEKSEHEKIQKAQEKISLESLTTTSELREGGKTRQKINKYL